MWVREKPPAVSVLMPVYNSGRYVEAAVRSILAQTFRDFELVIVDDGSDDTSPAVLEMLAREDRRIRLYQQPNQGLSRTRNRLVSLAESRLVAFMDSDDIATPERLEHQVAFLHQHPECVAVGSSVLLVCEEGIPIGVCELPLTHDQIEQGLLNADGGAICQSSIVMRRDAIVAVGGYNARYHIGEDLDLVLRLARHGRLANVPYVDLHYRQHLRSVMHTWSPEQGELFHEILVNAHMARGLDPPRTPPRYFSTPLPEDHELLVGWGWNALKHGQKLTATKYALRSLWRRPCTPEALRLIACILRGR